VGQEPARRAACRWRRRVSTVWGEAQDGNPHHGAGCCLLSCIISVCRWVA